MKKILVSACLLGHPCRYDGASKPCDEVIALADRFQLIPVCPEVLGGLETPRLPCELQGEVVRRCDGADESEAYQKGAEIALHLARENACQYALFKEKSPSCGSEWIYDGSFQKKAVPGEGVTTRLLRESGILVFSEKRVSLLLKDMDT